jgi:hypothetical protein
MGMPFLYCSSAYRPSLYLRILYCVSCIAVSCIAVSINSTGTLPSPVRHDLKNSAQRGPHPNSALAELLVGGWQVTFRREQWIHHPLSSLSRTPQRFIPQSAGEYSRRVPVIPVPLCATIPQWALPMQGRSENRTRLD